MYGDLGKLVLGARIFVDLAQIGHFLGNNRIYHRNVPCWHTSVIHGWKAVENADFWVKKSFGTSLILWAQGILSSPDPEADPLAYTASYLGGISNLNIST